MATEQDMTTRQFRAGRAAARSIAPARLAQLSFRGELIAYGLLWIALGLFLWSRIRHVNAFFLDEWDYVHSAEYIWAHLPGGAVDAIPGWDRGPQRLYMTLLAPAWGLFGTSTAFDISHVLNVVLLSSAVAPAALLARRIIVTPALRVLAVALAVAVPWLTIGSHLLAENLAFPLVLWAAYWTLRAAEAPSLRTQIPAVLAILATTLCRLNLASMFLVLVIAVLVAEVLDRRDHRDEPFARWLRRALRREALIIATAVAGFAAMIAVVAGGSSTFGRYGIVDGDVLRERLFGSQATETRRLMLTYARAFVAGSFVLPFVLGVAVALAGTCGRLGRRMVIPAVIGLSALVSTIVAVSAYNLTGAPEERYVFAVCTPIALLAVAGLEHLDRLFRWVIAAGALTVWSLLAGTPSLAADSGHFFAAPAGAFWTRVVEHRLRSAEDDLFGWLLIPPTGWLLVACGIGALAACISLGRRWPRARLGLLAGGLALCLVAQVVTLGYVFKQELYGTTDVRGGIAMAGERETWLDPALPPGASAAVLPGTLSPSSLSGDAERLQFWNKDVDATVSIYWNGTPVPVPPGDNFAIRTQMQPNGLAGWVDPAPRWLAVERDDPRVQFAGRVVARSPSSDFELLQLRPSPLASWTVRDVDGDGAVTKGRPATMTLDRATDPGVRRVHVTIRRPAGATASGGWRISRDGRTVATGRIQPGADAEVAVRVPRCDSGAACGPVQWRLDATGPAVPEPLPTYGAPPPPRPVLLHLVAARMER
jgi:hypothetical protein